MTLYSLVREKDTRIAELEEQNADQQARLDALEARLTALERRVGGTPATANYLSVLRPALGGLAILGAVVCCRRKEDGDERFTSPVISRRCSSSPRPLPSAPPLNPGATTRPGGPRTAAAMCWAELSVSRMQECSKAGTTPQPVASGAAWRSTKASICRWCCATVKRSMRTKKWVVQQELKEMLRKGTHNSRVLNRARVFLPAHENRYDEEVAQIVGVTTTTVANIRRRYVQGGLKAVFYDRPHPPDSHQEAYLIALVQSTPPEGRQRWTLRLLADRPVELGVVEHVYPETVCETLGPANVVHPGHRREVCGPDVYERPLEPGKVKVCVDERPYQLLADTQPSLPMEPGRPARQDYRTCNLFVALAP